MAATDIDTLLVSSATMLKAYVKSHMNGQYYLVEPGKSVSVGMNSSLPFQPSFKFETDNIPVNIEIINRDGHSYTTSLPLNEKYTSEVTASFKSIGDLTILARVYNPSKLVVDTPICVTNLYVNSNGTIVDIAQKLANM